MGYIYKIETDVYGSANAASGDRKKAKKAKEQKVWRATKRNMAPEVFPSSGMEERDSKITRMKPIEERKNTYAYTNRTVGQWEVMDDLYHITKRNNKPQLVKDENIDKSKKRFYDNPSHRFGGRVEPLHESILRKAQNAHMEMAAKAQKQWFEYPKRKDELAYYPKDEVITIQDTVHNMRHGRIVPKQAIRDIRKSAEAAQLTPEQTLLLASISSNESELGTTRDLFGMNDIYNDFGPETGKHMPESWEAKKLKEWYTGDYYVDAGNWIKRKTKNFTDLEQYNSQFQFDKKLNPRGETYTSRVMKNREVLLNNPQIMEQLLGEGWQEKLKMQNDQIAEQ